VVDSLKYTHIDIRIGHLVARLFFRGIYFPQLGCKSWFKVIWQNRRTIFKLVAAAAKKRNTSAVAFSKSTTAYEPELFIKEENF